MNKNIFKYSVLVIVLFLGACASVVSPTGGPKDVTPPVVLKTIPANFSKEFKGKSVKIDFDEYVKITDANSQLLVSPFMKEIPDLKIKGRSIIMEFRDTLKPNTTYTVSFGKAIADNNEGNILLNYRYVFSTGTEIDTLVKKGIVKNAFTLKPESGICVMLYNRIYDSVPYKEVPCYISKTDESGAFTFTNVKNGKYKLFALKDGNNNFMFDQSDEKIAFSDSLVTPEPDDIVKVDSSKKNKADTTKINSLKKNKADSTKSDSLKKNKLVHLFLFQEVPVLQKVLKTSATRYGKVVLVFRKPVESLDFFPLTKNLPSPWNLQETNDTKDTITLWLKNPDMDSLNIIISDNNKILDTARIALIKKNAKQLKNKNEEFKTIALRAAVRDNGNFDFFSSFAIKSSSPISEFDFKKIILTENKDTIKAKYSFGDSIKRRILIDYKWKEKTGYNLFIPPGTFKDIYNLTNDTLKMKFTTTSSSDYGNIKIAIKTTDIIPGYIVQLVTESTDAVVRAKFSKLNESIKFDNVPPGNYKIKIIYDKNNNKKWDTGNYLQKIQPEKIIYYPSTILVKQNWDLDLDWEITK